MALPSSLPWKSICFQCKLERQTSGTGEEFDDGHFIEDAEPFPEKAAAGGGEAAHLAGEGKVLAGEAGPDDVSVGDGGSADLLDGAEVEMVVAVVGGVAGGFLWADVVGPDRDAGMPGALGDKAAAREEIDKGWKSGTQ